MKRRSMLAMTLAVVLVCFAFAGCSDGGNSSQVSKQESSKQDSAQNGASTADSSKAEESSVGERQQISIMSITFNGNPVDNDNERVKQLEEYTNYDINFTWILDADYNDKINSMMAGGTLPEITLLKSLSSSVIQNCRAGAFWDLTDYLKDYTNLSQINETVLANTAIDGKTYGIPRTRTLMRNGIVYRKDWLDAVGLKPATSLDEFTEILRAFTKNDPDGDGQNNTWGLMSTKAETGFDSICMWFGAPNGWGEKDGQLLPAFMFDEYRQGMDYIKGLYDEGILNEDFAVLENSGVKDGFKAGKTGIYISNCDEANSWYTYFNDQKIDATMTVTAQFETPAGKVVAPTDGHAGMLSIYSGAVKDEENLKRCLTFLDRCNDKTAEDLLENGIEGIDYTINEDGETITKVEGNPSLGEHDGFNQIMMDVLDNGYNVKPSTDVAIEVKAAQDENMNYILANPAKILLLQSETNNANGSQLDQIMKDARIQYIVGSIDAAGYDAAIENWKNMGGTKVIEEVNAARK